MVGIAPVVDGLAVSIEEAVQEVDVETVGVDCDRALVAGLVVAASGHHLSGEIVGRVDHESVGHSDQAAAPAGFGIDGNSHVRHSKPGEFPVDLVGVCVRSVDRVRAPGGVHRTDGHVGADGKLREVVHGRACRVDADGTEVTSDCGHRIAHSYGPCRAVVVVLAESQSVVHRLRSRGNRGEHQ